MAAENEINSALNKLQKSQFASSIAVDSSSGSVTGDFIGLMVVKQFALNSLTLEGASEDKTSGGLAAKVGDLPVGAIVPIRFTQIDLSSGVVILFKQ